MFWAADIETLDGLEGKEFAIAAATNGKGVFTFPSAADLYRFITRAPKTVYFHNMNFDIRFLYQHCLENRIEFPPWVLSGSRILEQEFYVSGEKTSKCRDSYALLPLPLEALARVFGAGKKVSVDFANASFQQLRERCVSDCVLLHRSLSSFFEMMPEAKACITLPQAAMRIFWKGEKRWAFTARRQGKSVEVSPHEEKARLGYHGGRNEIFDLRLHEDVRCYDVNSLYPAVMRDNVYPVSMARLGKRSLEYPLYYVHARVELPYQYIPPLPFKANKLLFTVGEMEGWFYSPEFEIVREMGCSFEIMDGYAFQGEPIFRDFISKWYGMRLEMKRRNDPREKVVKLFMNSLYGKFGQRRQREALKIAFEPREGREELQPGIYGEPEMSISKTQKINPFIAGFITSYARARLYSLMDEDTLYCDTDSVFTTKVMREGDGLGELKLEGRGAFQPLAPKCYFFHDGSQARHKAKGIFRSSIPDAETPGDFIAAVKKVRKRIYAQPVECIRRFGCFLEVKEIEKTQSFTYDKRKVMDNKTTQPFFTDEVLAMASAQPGIDAAYEEWASSDYYDPHLEDSTLTAHERLEEFRGKWKFYTYEAMDCYR